MRYLFILLLAFPLVAADAPLSKLAVVTVAVADYDEALTWYTDKLGFRKMEDRAYGDERWITVAPPDQPELRIALAKPGMTPEERQANKALIGTGGPWVFHTKDCAAAHKTLSARGVKFTDGPRDLPWGIQATFRDLYGNRMVLLQPK
jgi:predicted enzyme related to lactoylglutathione lyase